LVTQKSIPRDAIYSGKIGSVRLDPERKEGRQEQWG
jgi:hypothetical protein